MNVITHACWDESKFILVKQVPCCALQVLGGTISTKDNPFVIEIKLEFESL